MAVLDEKVKLCLVLSVEKNGVKTNVPISDTVDVNQIYIESEKDLKVLADSIEKFLHGKEESLAQTLISNIAYSPEDKSKTKPKSKSKTKSKSKSL